MQLEDSTEARVVQESQKNDWIQNMVSVCQVTHAFSK